MKTPSRTLLSAALCAALAGTAEAATYEVQVVNLTRGQHFTPLAVAAHTPETSVFEAGTAASAELQAVAEGGDTTALGALLESVGAVLVNGEGLLAPGDTATFTLDTDATPDNTVLSLVGMLLPTNDGFVGVSRLVLPDGGPGDSVTITALGYDAGTEANDEVVGSGAPGEAGFPLPPPVEASGTGTGATGVASTAEGFVHVHRNVLGDTDAAGGTSDIDSRVHRWLNPVARVSVTVTGE